MRVGPPDDCFQCDFCKETEQKVVIRNHFFGGCVYDVCVDCASKITNYVIENLTDIREKIKRL